MSKIIFVFNRINTSYHVNCWSELEAEIKEMYVCTCTRAVCLSHNVAERRTETTYKKSWDH